ncbi:quinon protein alcohol dehydrogenase-like superfamily [Haematococcus lacustris]
MTQPENGESFARHVDHHVHHHAANTANRSGRPYRPRLRELDVPMSALKAFIKPNAAPAPLAEADNVNKDTLHKIKDTFKLADVDGSGRLALDEFVQAFLGILHTEDGKDEDALGKLFMRIDANSDGTLDWDEFANYMLLESQGAASIRDLESSINFDKPEDVHAPEEHHHKKIVTHISHVTLPNGADRYITSGKDGLVKVWNAKDMKHVKTVNTGKSWVTCTKWLPGTHKLAVASFARAVKIYDLLTFEQCGQIPEVEAPMSMDAWVPQRNQEVELVVFGDGGGWVRLYELRVNHSEEKHSTDRYTETEKWQYKHHSDWVTAVRYIEEMNAVMACSLDKTISITDAEERVPLKLLQGHLKGVNTVDWSKSYKCIASGAQDKRVMLWNPFSQRPLATLHGHAASVQSVMVVDNQVISVSSDKMIKLWDIRNHKCIQTVNDRETYLEEDTLLCSCYDVKRHTLVTANLAPKLWRQKVTTSASSGHRHPVTCVLYNPFFDEAVSGDHSGSISVWHVVTGKLRFRFHNAHKGHQLTAMAFDKAKRRLLTGCDMGEVKVWNFSSGQCLCTLHARCAEEVTAIVAVRSPLFRQFLVAGWDRKITYYEDCGSDTKEVTAGRVIQGHKSDILGMAVMENHPVLVSVADDGEACTWNIEGGSLRRRCVPPGHAHKPVNERAVEAVAFLSGKLRHVFVTVGADRFLRMWSVSTGDCLVEMFTGHKLGESVVALAVQPANLSMATADSAGFIKEAAALIRQTAVWRAHKAVVTSVQWVSNKHGEFVLTSSLDHQVAMWSASGALLGLLGHRMWQLSDAASWRCSAAVPLEPREAFELQVSEQPARYPGRAPPLDTDAPTLTPTPHAPAANHPSPLHPHRPPNSPGPLPPSPNSPPSAPSPGHAPMTPGRRSRVISASCPARTPRQGPGQSAAARTPPGPQAAGPRAAAGGELQWQGSAGLALQSSILSHLAGTATQAAGPAGGSNRPGVLAGLQPLQLAGLAQGGAEGWWLGQGEGQGGPSGVGTPRSQLLPVVSAPQQVARVLEQAQEDRLRRNMSRRRAERPQDFEPGGRYSRPGSSRAGPHASPTAASQPLAGGSGPSPAATAQVSRSPASSPGVRATSASRATRASGQGQAAAVCWRVGCCW